MKYILLTLVVILLGIAYTLGNMDGKREGIKQGVMEQQAFWQKLLIDCDHAEYDRKDKHFILKTWEDTQTSQAISGTLASNGDLFLPLPEKYTEPHKILAIIR